MNTKMYGEIAAQPEVLRHVLTALAPLEEELSRRVRAAEKLFLFGTGASLNACFAAIDPFVRHARLYPIVLPAAEVEKYLGVIDEKSLVIVLSQSGESYETKQLCRILTAHGVPFCGVTNEPGSTLGQAASLVLPVGAGVEVSSATKTHTASLLLLYLAALSAAGKAGAASDLPEVTAQILATAQPKVDAFAHALHREPLMYVLSDNLNYATARQGALMIKEKALLCAEGMTISEYRHGAVEVTRPGMCALLISTETAFEAEFQRHAAHLQTLGMRLFLISTTPFAAVPEEATLLLPKTAEECLSPLAATVPLQLLAERMALYSGYNVDGFVHLSKIVGTY